MGKTEDITCSYLKNDKVFADVLNIALYSGKSVVAANDLYDMDTSYRVVVPPAKGNRDLLNNNTYVGKNRDIIRIVKQEHGADDGGFCVRIIAGVEQQTNVHYAMPVRDMLYDALEYSSQIKKKSEINKGKIHTKAEFLSGMKKEDKLIPVITIVVYLQLEKWDGPESLHEMLDFTGLTDEVRKLVPDYKMILLQPSDYDEIKAKGLNSSPGTVMGLLQNAGEKHKFNNYMEKYKKKLQELAPDAVMVLNEYCDFNIDENRINGEEVIDVCKAVQEIREEERLIGKSEGMRIGLFEGEMLAYLKMGLDKEIIAEKMSCTRDEVEKFVLRSKE